jgi:hypothetical protein
VLVRDDGDSWLAITQPAHAHLAGQIARHWTASLGADALLAIEQHDVAWWEWDREPPLHEGRAAAFFEAPIERRLAIWQNVARHLEAQSPYAAVLISLHATNIHTRYLPEDQRPQDLLDGARADQDRLLALLPDLTREQAEREAEVLFAIDRLSLALCFGSDTAELLHPWPLDTDAIEVAIYGRRMTERFDDEAAMQAALAATPYERLSFSLRR